MKRYSGRSLLAMAAAVAVSALTAEAQEVRLTADRTEAVLSLNDRSLTIGRIQDEDNRLTGEFSRTSRACPPFCIQPVSAGDGVETLGELEVIGFLEAEVAGGTGLLIDSRLPDFFAAGTIPGAVNVPFSVLAADNPYRDDILRALGATGDDGDLDFAGAFDLVLFSNGPWSDQSPRAIRNLFEAGYPAEKLGWYRGGMQDWLILGLSVDVPGTEG